MATSTKPKTDYEKWQDTIDQAKTDARWNGLDDEIKTALSEYGTHLAKSSKGFPPLGVRLIKAMVWTESGGPDNKAWATRPMQIGNAGDPGLKALLSGHEGGEIIMPPALRLKLSTANVSTPAMNIRAGIGYLLLRAATFEHVTVFDAIDTAVHEVTVKAGDSLSKIAAAQGTTIETLSKLNPTAVAMIKPGQTLKYRKASVRKVVKSWSSITTALIAQRYNTVKGDPAYQKKLDYCLTVMAP